MKHIILLILPVFLLGCTQDKNVEHAVVTDSYVLGSTLVNSEESTPDKITAILKRLDERNHDLQQQQQISKDAKYDSNIYREITRLNNVIIDLRIKNDTLREENAILNKYLSTDLNSASQVGLIYSEDDMLAENTRIRIYDLILMYNIIAAYSNYITDSIASDQARYDMLNIAWELENYGIDNVDEILLDEFDLDELVKRGNLYNE